MTTKLKKKKVTKMMVAGKECEFTFEKWFHVVANVVEGKPVVYINGVKL